MRSLNRHIAVLSLLYLMIIGIAGCGTPDHEMAQAQSSGLGNVDTLSLDALKNRVTLTQPDTQHKDSKVYGDSIRAIVYNKKEAILITGNFSNGCTHLNDVRYSSSGDTLNIFLEGWQPRDKMCTQALEPFQYIDASRTSEWLSQFGTYKFRDP